MQKSSADESIGPTLSRQAVLAANRDVSTIQDKTLGHRLKAAGALVAKTAERARLKSVSLPNAYQELGRHIQISACFEDEFVGLFQQLTELNLEQASLEKATANQTTAAGFKDKLKSTVVAAKRMAEKKSLQRRVHQLQTELGAAAFEKHTHYSGPIDIIAPINQIRSRIVSWMLKSKALRNPMLWPRGQHTRCIQPLHLTKGLSELQNRSGLKRTVSSVNSSNVHSANMNSWRMSRSGSGALLAERLGFRGK